MLRLVGFFALVILLTWLLGQLPFIGPLFRSTGCIGIWLTAMGLSWLITYYGKRAYQVRRSRTQVRQLLSVDTPTNRGKLGSLFLAQGRATKALPHLVAATEGEPEVAEWHYRHGCALLKLKRDEEALEALERCVALEEEYRYGAAQMRRVETLAALGRDEEALEVLALIERNHGPGPEAAYRRGLALKSLGRRDEARQAFGEVSQLAAQAAHYQRQQAGLWSVRARIASLF